MLGVELSPTRAENGRVPRLSISIWGLQSSNCFVRLVVHSRKEQLMADLWQEALAELRAGEMMVLRQRALLGDALEASVKS